jgi:integrase
MSTKKARAKNGNLSWESVKKRLRLIVPAPYSPNGRQKRISLRRDDTPENRGEAEKIITRIHLDIEDGEYNPEKLHEYIFRKPKKIAKTPPSISVKEPSLDELWSRYVAHKSKNWAQTSIQIIGKRIGSHINKLTTKKLSDALQIESELSHLSYSVKYKVLTYISACCKWAVNSQLISHNPFLVIVDGLKPPKSAHDPDPFTREEMERIIVAYEKHPRYSYLAPFVKFLFFTGCRTGEGVALQWKNVTDKYIYFRASISSVGAKHIYREGTKTEACREFPRVNQNLNKLLEQLKPEKVNPDDFVFQEPTGGHILYSAFYVSWFGNKRKKKFYKGIVSTLESKTEAEGGIDHYRSPYSTRHTFITLALETMAAKRLLTPSDVSQLAKYVGNSPTMIYEHYLGRSGNEQLVNIDIDGTGSPPPQTSVDGSPNNNELGRQLAVANQAIAEQTEQQQTSALSQKLPTPVEPTSNPESPSSSPEETVSSLKANKKDVSRKSLKTEPSEPEFKQLALLGILEGMVNSGNGIEE